MSRRTALLVCPGRGVYNAPELGYLARHHAGRAALIAGFDAQRRALGQTPVADLDAADRFSLARYSRGDNASALIYACSYADSLVIDRNSFEIVAVTGNSMGWYTALACAGAVSGDDGFRIVNTMGTLMQDTLVGGQIVYPFVDESWQDIPGERGRLLALTQEIADLHVSIWLGGLLVFAGSAAALDALEARLAPTQGRYPMRLANHAAFHTPLQSPVAQAGQAALPVTLFGNPAVPLIDGRGHIWWPGASDPAALHGYTLGEQVTTTYDFTRAIVAGLREFAPDVLILTGPGATLGGATAQALIAAGWQGLADKAGFQQRQAADPLVLAMGIEAQRGIATGSASA